MPSRPFFAHLKNDLPASLVVFLVALPLCLGIALASGAPPISGVIAGIVGGILVGAVSGSHLGVSGPAAGLAVIVLNSISDLKSFELFLCAVILTGVFQIVLGVIRAGVLAYYFPSNVIKGMLAGIGLIIILKQIPHAIGYNHDYEGSMFFDQPEHENTISAFSTMLGYVNVGSILIAALALGVLILWEKPFIKRTFLGAIPGPLLAVMMGIGLGLAFQGSAMLALGSDFFVSLPDIDFTQLSATLQTPDWSGFTHPSVWKVAMVMCIVASLETLLCVEATDKLDPERRVTPTNRELVAQGLGNAVAGLIGGLPITQVIVRSSANLQSGGKTKISAIFHGFWLLASLLLIPGLLRMIPLASLAAVLLVVGYKLAKPELFVSMWKKGVYQFVPFTATVLGVVFTDLLTGVMIGMGIGIVAILYSNYRIPFHFDEERYKVGEPVRIELSEDVSFLNKASVRRTLENLPRGAHVVIDATSNVRLDPDVEEILHDAKVRAPARGVRLEFVGLDGQSKTRRPGTVTMVHRQVATQPEVAHAAESPLPAQPSVDRDQAS